MTIHQIIEQARHTGCSCGALPERPCACRPGAVHLARIARARRQDRITRADFASVICDADVYTGTTCVLDPEVTP